MLEHRRCPHCGYDLRGLPDESNDGATICPECGSAWILAADAADREASS
jgi:ribosomal protein S27AE